MAYFRIREATKNGIPGMAKVRVDTWRAACQGLLPAEFLENLSYENVSEHWSRVFWEDRNPAVALLVAENDGQQIIGIAVCGAEQDQDAIYEGEIYVLYVLPFYQHQGIGRELVAACVRHLLYHLGMKSLLIRAIADNPYRRFYESLGGTVVREKTREMGGKLIREAGYG